MDAGFYNPIIITNNLAKIIDDLLIVVNAGFIRIIINTNSGPIKCPNIDE